MARFFLADPSLTSLSGHCYEYLASLAEPLHRRGHKTFILGNRGVDPELRTRAGVIPMFTHWCDARFGTPEETRTAHEIALRAELRAIGHTFQVSADDVFLINTLRHWALRGVVEWLEELAPQHRPTVVLVLHFTSYPQPDQSDGSVEHYRQAFARFEASPAGERIILLADSEELVSEYREINPNLRYLLAPIPHVRPQPRAAGRGLAGLEERRLRLGYVGEARVHKGFHLLPYLLQRLERSEHRDRFEMHVHSFCSNPGADFYRRAIPRLQRPQVTLYPYQMDADEYFQLMSSLDVMLVPYQTVMYHAQTSGIFSEAMANEQVLVVPKGTWMARQLARFGGGTVFNPDDAEDFSSAVLQAIAGRHEYLAAAGRRIERWCAFHNPERLIDMVLSSGGRLARAA